MLTEGVLVLGRHGPALGGLLDRQRDAPTVEIDVDDLDPQLLAALDDLLGRLDVVDRHLGDVHETLDALAHLDERAEGHELRDPSVDELADLVAGRELLPRVLLGRLERERDALAGQVDVEDLHRDLVAHLHDGGRVVDVLPRQLGHVDETVHATEVHERTEVDDRGDHTGADLAGLQVREEVVALFALGLLEVRAPREHDVVAVLVELDDLALERPADERLQVAHATEVDEGCRQEAAQADVDDEAALDDLDDRTGDDALLLLDLLDRAPGALVLRALLGQDEPAVLVLLLEDERLELLAERDDLGRVDVVADREFLRGDDALGLEADVEQHLVGVDLHDGAGDEAALVELDEGGVDRIGQGDAVEVVEHDLGGAALLELGGGVRLDDGGFGLGGRGGDLGLLGHGVTPRGQGRSGTRRRFRNRSGARVR